MSSSLRDQLLKLGLADEKRANKAKQEKRQQVKEQKAGKKPDPAAEEERRMWAQKEAEKVARDRELNRQKEEAARRKASIAEIKQLIDANRLPKNDDDIAYNFVDDRKVKRIYVNAKVRARLAAGTAAIVKLHGQYNIVPAEIAEKIRQRDASCVIEAEKPEPAAPAQEDPYAKYQVPDDLMW